MAFGDVVSSDVVGYDTTALLSGGAAKGVGASFVNVDKSEMTLSDLSVTGYDVSEGYADFQVYAQKLDGAGMTLGTDYYWCDFEEDGETYKGWYDADMNEYNDEPLVPGEGLWIYSPSADLKVQSAGAVPTAPIAVTLRDGGAAKLVVNPMPASLKFGLISISGYVAEEGYADFQIYAQKLDGAGMTLGTDYYWCDFEEDGDTYFGWYDADMNEYNTTEELAAGEGLWIYSPSTDYSVVFPSPL